MCVVLGLESERVILAMGVDGEPMWSENRTAGKDHSNDGCGYMCVCGVEVWNQNAERPAGITLLCV